MNYVYMVIKDLSWSNLLNFRILQFECNNLLSNVVNSDGYGHTAGEKSRLHEHVVHWWKKALVAETRSYQGLVEALPIHSHQTYIYLPPSMMKHFNILNHLK